ncbi:MAG: beta-ketoacyl-ACP synthase II, partial [Gammaproteobacteria bacterium]|nr:beta-ketoacyl-ACP synthase II [Gammaproteobacteria bacterium]NIR98134.1 beta-ketoacyl-ACP synthase II [Gammaproteobacteria bacterium]NIT63825.1 beta-ketoacyl-ACP synthase II [Gammaproteobacteria bacterium]NIV20778.1 beta-ketoacyl-ACP synthase II [Gammaproteobacteria bacterium]NIX10025.1 beta-ketoacyl-ACP synthase II [Gammaproteobacteria bacterium]
DRITRFDATDFRSQMAGEVRDFDPAPVIPGPEQKKMDIFIHYALVATAEAVRDAGLEIDEELAPE